LTATRVPVATPFKQLSREKQLPTTRRVYKRGARPRFSDRLGHLCDYTFDAFGNSIGQRLVLTGNQVDSSSQRYDDSERAITATNAGGNVTQMAYADASNLTNNTPCSTSLRPPMKHRCNSIPDA